MFSHYESDPELTAQSVVDGWFLTSDEGRFAEDGRLEIVGRIDDVVISGGVKIPLAAVADRIRQHLQVEQAEVFGVPDAEWGQKLVAVVVGTANDAELRDWISMVHPRSWAPREFVRAGSLPLLANGKVDRQAIQAGALMPDAAPPARLLHPAPHPLPRHHRARGRAAARRRRLGRVVAVPGVRRRHLAAVAGVRARGRRRGLAGAAARPGAGQRHRPRDRPRAGPRDRASPGAAAPPR